MAYIHKKKKSNRNRQFEHKRKERMKVYNTKRWRAIRDWKMATDPLCEMCKQDEKVTPAEEVHHVVSFMSTDDPDKRYNLAYDYDNLKSLCKGCHQKVHNQN